jgi:hypothetical protein
MSKYISLVKKWLEDNSSVSLEELKANADAAALADAKAKAAARAARDASAAKRAADAAAWCAADAVRAAAGAINATYWVRRYEELTNEK